MKSIVLILFLGLGPAGLAAAAETNAAPALSLAAARQLALQRHPQIMAAKERALAAQEVTKEQRAGYFPQANLYGTAAGDNSLNTRIMAGGINNPSVYERAAGGVAVTQLLTDFGRTANLTASARFAAQAELQNAAGTRAQVLLQVDTSYLAALEAQAVLQVAQQTFATRQLVLDQVSALATNKLRSELDVSFAQVALEEGRLLVQKSQNDADAAMASLATALGLNEAARFQLTEPMPLTVAATNDIADLIQMALSRRPELLSLRAEQESALRLAKAQRDARLPTLSAIGVAGGSPIHDSRLDDSYAAAAVQLSLPLFAGGLYTARQHEAELRAQAESETLRSEENDIIRDVRLVWLNLNSAADELRTTEQLVKHATEAYQLADARYRAGISSIVELSQAQLALTSAQIISVDARYAVLIQQASLAYQTGQNNP